MVKYKKTQAVRKDGGSIVNETIVSHQHTRHLELGSEKPESEILLLYFAASLALTIYSVLV